MTSSPRTQSVRLAVILVSALIVTSLTQLPTWAATPYTITISAGMTSNVVPDGGSPNTFTPTGAGAVLNVVDLEAALAAGAVVVGTPDTTSAVVLAVDIASTNDLTIGAPAQLAADITVSLSAGGLTFASSLDGNHTASIDTAAHATMTGAIGSTSALTGLAVTADTISLAGALTVTGGLILTSSGSAIVQGGAWTVAGDSMIDAGTGSITLTNAGNDFTGALSLSGGTAQVKDQNGLTLDGPQVGSLRVDSGDSVVMTGSGSVPGDLTLHSTNASIAQTAGALVVGGASEVDAGSGAITLTSGANDFGGSVALVGGDTQLSDATALSLGTLDVGSLTARSTGALLAGSGSVGGALGLTSDGGTIGQSGPLAVAGATVVDAGSGAITLTNAGNDFGGSVSVTGGNTQLVDANALTLAAVDVDALAALAGETLAVLDGRPVASTGTMVLAAGRTGRLQLGPGATLAAGAPIALYAADQDRVDVGTGVTLNGASYVPGDAYVNTDRERWGVAYPSGTPVAAFTFFFNDLGSQSLTFTSSPPSPGLVGGSYTPVATSSAGLPVAIYVDAASAAICSIDGSGTVHFVAPGTCLVEASQAGDATHDAATPVQQAVPVVAPAPPAGLTFPGPVTDVDTATSTSPTDSATVRSGCVRATGLGVGTVTAATYTANPVGRADFRAAGAWFDVLVHGGSGFTSLELTCAANASTSEANTLYWWDGHAWELVESQHYDPDSRTISTTLSGISSPSLAELTGTVFALGTRPLVSRLAGADRVHTAIEVSREAYRDGTAGAVVLAASGTYPDALVGGPLAVAKGGPLLVTGRARISPAVETEIRRVLPAGGTVVLLGGQAALSSSLAKTLSDLGFTVRRLGGATRYDTAVRVARELPHPERVLLATGTDFPDALAAGAAAAHAHGVVLLTDGANLPEVVRRWLSKHPQLPQAAIGAPAAGAAPAAERLVGEDRYATAALVAERLFGNPATVGVANGEAFPDALSAVALLGRDGAPLLLTRAGQLPAPTSGWLNGHRTALDDVVVVGGTAAIASAVQEEIVGAVAGIG
ncbi:MAG: cell wall-binding repeat-containing protein [Nocardioides sp.]